MNLIYVHLNFSFSGALLSKASVHYLGVHRWRGEVSLKVAQGVGSAKVTHVVAIHCWREDLVKRALC
jgi:hypothetical protein